MANGWGGADPTGFHDAATDYELGTRYLANDHVTVNQVRVWAPAASASLANRRGYVRSTADVILGTAVLPDSLPSGWSVYDLNTPVDIAAGVQFWVTYGTQDDYGAIAAALPQTSGDGALTANLGGFNGTVGNLPTSNGTTFYGVDVTYDVVPSTAPTVGISVTTSVLTASATLTIDDDTPGTVTYAIEWGDGQSGGVVGLGPHAHTYAAAGTYAVMVTATDQDGNTDSAAVAITIRDAVPAGLNLEGVLTALTNHAAASGKFDNVLRHEPKNAPGGRLTLALWVQAIEPADSGLASTSVKIVAMARIYHSAFSQSPDRIDPAVIRAVDRFIAAVTGDFTLGGLVRCVDLLGVGGGTPLSAQAGYLDQDGKIFRVMDVTVPLILNDVWTQFA